MYNKKQKDIIKKEISGYMSLIATQKQEMKYLEKTISQNERILTLFQVKLKELSGVS